MSRFVIERYIHDALNAQATLDGNPSEGRFQLARTILRDIDIYLADHMDDVRHSRARLAERHDDESREMLAFVDAALSRHARAETLAAQAIARARRS